MRSMLVLLLVIFTLPGLAQEDDEGALSSTYAYTMPSPTGNRFVEGRGTFPNVQGTTLPLGGEPTWLVGTAVDENVVTWITTLTDGGVQGVFADPEPSISPVVPDVLPGRMPPVFVSNEIGSFPQEDLPDDLAPLSHPITTDTRTVYIAEGGAVVLRAADEGAEIIRLPLGALPDGRVTLNSTGTQAAVYVGATDERYVHDVLGDALEGAALMVLDLETGAVPAIVELSGDEVFEGLSPLWADVDADGTDDLVTTVSFGGGGAQLRVYRADGTLLASGDPIGQSNRWRHQLALGPFGPNGERELVDVVTPHIGGLVSFYRYDGADRLEVVARQAGYTSHIINSRNLDMAVAGDFNGDGQPEIVLPSQDRTRIAGLQHAAEGEVREVWSLPLEGGRVLTNLSAVALPDGRLALAVGLDDNTLRVWLPG